MIKAYGDDNKKIKFKIPIPFQEFEFLDESNKIEKEFSIEALEDAVKAWQWAKKQEINLKTVLGIHKRLMKRLRPDIAGKLRDCDVWIGRDYKPFISEALIKEDLERLIRCMNLPTYEMGEELENALREEHIVFEKIHPFEDGNGRVGRILYNLQRIRSGLPIHVIHTGKEQLEYYGWFR